MKDKIARGIRLDNGQIIIGELNRNIIFSKVECAIDGVPVDPIRIDYWTRRYDKNEQMIFSGDYVLLEGEVYLISYLEKGNNFMMGRLDFAFYHKNKINLDDIEIIDK